MVRGYAATARLVLEDPQAILDALGEHMEEHGGRLEKTDDGSRLRFAHAEASFRHDAADTRIDIVASTIEDLYFARLMVASHIAEFAGTEPDIEWTGDGRDLARPPNFQILRVAAIRDLTPRMRRLTLSGSNLQRFATMDALHLNVLVQRPGRAEPQWPNVGANGLMTWEDPDTRPDFRKYTVRSVDPDAGTLDIDFVRHPDAGPGARLAEEARLDDLVGILGPGGGGLAEADWYLFAGDETALPAIARMLEHLPDGAEGKALIEVADAREIQPIRHPVGVEVKWLLRNSREINGAETLAQAVGRIGLPTEALKIYAWAGCEFKAFRAIRNDLRHRQQRHELRHLIVAYWRQGFSE